MQSWKQIWYSANIQGPLARLSSDQRNADWLETRIFPTAQVDHGGHY